MGSAKARRKAWDAGMPWPEDHEKWKAEKDTPIITVTAPPTAPKRAKVKQPETVYEPEYGDAYDNNGFPKCPYFEYNEHNYQIRFSEEGEKYLKDRNARVKADRIQEGSYVEGECIFCGSKVEKDELCENCNMADWYESNVILEWMEETGAKHADDI